MTRREGRLESIMGGDRDTSLHYDTAGARHGWCGLGALSEGNWSECTWIVSVALGHALGGARLGYAERIGAVRLYVAKLGPARDHDAAASQHSSGEPREAAVATQSGEAIAFPAITRQTSPSPAITGTAQANPRRASQAIQPRMALRKRSRTPRIRLSEIGADADLAAPRSRGDRALAVSLFCKMMGIFIASLGFATVMASLTFRLLA